VSARHSAAALPSVVIARLDRAIQYADILIVTSMSRGVLDARLRGHDDLCCQ
jgi:hypothetical protein